MIEEQITEIQFIVRELKSVLFHMMEKQLESADPSSSEIKSKVEIAAHWKAIHEFLRPPGQPRTDTIFDDDLDNAICTISQNLYNKLN